MTTPRVGDPDPRPDRTNLTPCCEATHPGGFICTSEPHHTGPHVAGNGFTVCEVWE